MGFVRAWAGRDACRPAPRVTWERAAVERFDWMRCRGAAEVAHLRLVGGTHAWPGADPPDSGPQLGVSASAEAWAFLKSRHLAPLPHEHDAG